MGSHRGRSFLPDCSKAVRNACPHSASCAFLTRLGSESITVDILTQVDPALRVSHMPAVSHAVNCLSCCRHEGKSGGWLVCPIWVTHAS